MNTNSEIKNAKQNIEAYDIMKENGFLDLLNGDVDNLAQAIEDFEAEIDLANKPINRQDRKILDLQYKKLVGEINRIENNLENYKDTDPEKYESEMAKLHDCKDKLEQVNKKYNKACPLGVKQVRSAKKFFKKHKKGILLAAGIATVALLAQPVLIPAIMHGNMLIGSKVAFLNPILSAINKKLASAINANVVKTVVNGVTTYPWHLASGTIISPNTATAALLRGVASVALGSVPLVGGVVVSIKALADKIIKREQKEKSKLMPAVKEKTAELTQKSKELVENIGKRIPKKSDGKKDKELKTLKHLREEISKLSPEAINDLFVTLNEEQKQIIMKAYATEDDELSETEDLSEEKGMKR